MKKINGLCTLGMALLLAMSIPVAAANWEKSFDLSLTATQSTYSDSWVGGDVGNFAWTSLGTGIFQKQLSSFFNWKNSIRLAYGQTYTQDTNRVWSKPSKSTDNIDLESVGLFTTNTLIEPYMAFRFESQFLDASVMEHKRYVNPILLTESAGLAKQIFKKDKNDILSRVGFAFRENIDRMLQPPDSSTTKAFTTNDGGIESVTDIKLVLADKLGYVGKITLYKALFFSHKNDYLGTPQENYWKAVHVNWENSITASITKYVQVVLYSQLLYDKLISLRGRLKETLSLGLTYKLL